MELRRINHAAFRCRDARETVEFYTQVLGLRFAHAVGGNRVPSTLEHDPHIHVFFDFPDGSSVAFFEVPLSPGGMKDTTMHDWIQHLAFEVDDEAALDAARTELLQLGLNVLGPVDHGFLKSIYFHDPSGHRLEITCRLDRTGDKERFEAAAPRLLERWDQHHDWSNVSVGIDIHD